MKKLSATTLMICAALLSHAQGGAASGDIFAGNLKIYVVVAVLAIILGCIFFFLFSLEGRLKKLEAGK